MKKIVALALLLSLCVLLAACSTNEPAGPAETPAGTPAGTPTVAPAEATTGADAAVEYPTMQLTVGGQVEVGSPYEVGLAYMGDLLETRSGGAITYEYFPQGLLGTELECLEQVGNSTMDMTIGSSANLANFAPEMGLFDLPYLIESRESAYPVFDSDLMREVYDSVNSSNLYVFGLLDQGFRHLTNNKEAITNIDQIQGFKVRVMENPVHQALWTALGAYPTPMAWGEVLTALEQGTIDGQENPFNSYISTKSYEVQHFCTLSGHVYSPGYIVIDYSLLNSFDDATKALFIECANEAIAYEREYVIESDAGLMDVLADYGMTFSELEDKEVWVERATTIYDQFASNFKPEWIEAFQG